MCFLCHHITFLCCCFSCCRVNFFVLVAGNDAISKDGGASGCCFAIEMMKFGLLFTM
ncbi:hypothetical protein GLYMA_18G233750v4 [Glycine max]|nr:hypothetical protein GLYMA_18G233750v4 [Glycine max]KAH1155826.1 hypothetical protein GYH30_050888 [Glycine max]